MTEFSSSNDRAFAQFDTVDVDGTADAVQILSRYAHSTRARDRRLQALETGPAPSVVSATLTHRFGRCLQLA